MTWADLVAAIVKSGVDIHKPARVRLGPLLLTDVKEFRGNVATGRGCLIPAAPLYTQADLDAARDEAYGQGVADAKAGTEWDKHLEPALEGGAA